MLSSNCLKENPWHKFPFSGFVSMMSVIVTLMVDSMATSIYSKNHAETITKNSLEGDQEMHVASGSHFHGFHHRNDEEIDAGSQLLRYRVIAMVTLSILFHEMEGKKKRIYVYIFF